MKILTSQTIHIYKEVQKMIDDIKKYKTIHFIGIGGISMSGIAETLNNLGIHVTRQRLGTI